MPTLSVISAGSPITFSSIFLMISNVDVMQSNSDWPTVTPVGAGLIRIINISSGAAYEGQIGQNAYSASKSGVLGLNMPASRELGPLGIRVNAICPGLFGTPMVKGLDQKVQDTLVGMIEAPRRMGEMHEFAHCCAFLVENGYMNGRTIRLDAATVMQAR